MKRDDEKYQAYVQILKEELIPAMVWIRDTHTGIVRTKKRGNSVCRKRDRGG